MPESNQDSHLGASYEPLQDAGFGLVAGSIEASPNLLQAANPEELRQRIQELQLRRQELTSSINPGQDMSPEVRDELQGLQQSLLELNALHIKIDGTTGMNPNQR